jgi:multidrug efflux system membrane fusion protein
MRKRLIVIFILIVVAGLSLYAYTRSHAQQPGGAAAAAGSGAGGGGRRGGQGGPGQVIPVSVATATSQDVPIYLNGLGSVEAYNTVTLKTRVDGPITAINFKEGQDVKKGQLLVEIDPRQYQVAVSQAEATLYRDQSQLTIAQRNFARYQDLFKQGIVSQQDYDAQESTKGQLEGTVRADQAAIDNAKLNLSYTRITSPINGKVGLRQADIGNVVHAGDANGLAVITQLQPISIIFTIPEDSLPSVLQKFKGNSLPVDVYSRDNQTKLGSANLVTVNNQIDPTTGTVKLKAVSENKDGMLWPSQFVNARLLLDVKKNAVVVPAAAVQHGSQGFFAFVVKPGNTVEMRTLQPGVADGNLTVIDQGLAPGEVVVTDGQDKLQSDSKISTGSGQQGGQGGGGTGQGGGRHRGQGQNPNGQAPTGQQPNQQPNAQPPQGQQQPQQQPPQQGQRQRRGNK